MKSREKEDTRICTYARSVWDQVWKKVTIESLMNALHENSGNPMIETHLPYVQKLLTDRDNGDLVLDAGCGLGQWVFYAEELGHQAIGIDIALDALRRAKEWGFRQSFTAEFVLADVRRLPFRDDVFDCVLSFGVIEHFHGPVSILKEKRRVLNRGGKLLATVPNVFCSHTILRPIQRALGVWALGYETSYSPTRFRKICELSGFRVDTWGVMPGGELFGYAPSYIPLIGETLQELLRRVAFYIEKKIRILGFWSFAVCRKIEENDR